MKKITLILILMVASLWVNCQVSDSDMSTYNSTYIIENDQNLVTPTMVHTLFDYLINSKLNKDSTFSVVYWNGLDTLIFDTKGILDTITFPADALLWATNGTGIINKNTGGVEIDSSFFIPHPKNESRIAKILGWEHTTGNVFPASILNLYDEIQQTLRDSSDAGNPPVYGTWVRDSANHVLTTVNPDSIIIGVRSAENTTKKASVRLEVIGDILSTGTEWTLRTAFDVDWGDVCYGNGLFVAVADITRHGSNHKIMTSPDGINWTQRDNPVDSNLLAICYGNGLFVTVGVKALLSSTPVMTSPDGINWTQRTAPADYPWNDVCYGNGLFVAVATDGADRVMTSPDGITWTLRSTPCDDEDWYGITFGNGLFVASADNNGAGVHLIMTSPDGINWTGQHAASGDAYLGICYGNGVFVATGQSGTIMASPDGINWTQSNVSSDDEWTGVTYGAGLFVAVAFYGFHGQISTSPDGINWTQRTAPAMLEWRNVAYGNGMFVAVAWSGTTTRVMTSGKMQNMTDHYNNIVAHDRLCANLTGDTYTPNVTTNTPFKFAAEMTVGINDGFTFEGDSIIISKAGNYQLDLAWSISCETSQWSLKVKKNGTFITTGDALFTLPTGFTNSFCWFYSLPSLSAGDRISIYITNLTNSYDPTFTSFKIFLEKLTSE